MSHLSSVFSLSRVLSRPLVLLSVVLWSFSPIYAQIEVVSGGNVGIGTTTPAYKLDVNGTLNAGAGSFTTLSASDNVTVTGTGIRYAKVASTTTGSANVADLRLDRGDQANGFARVGHYTAGSLVWCAGIVSGDANYHIQDGTFTDRVVVSTTGLTVTGALYSTSNAGFGLSNNGTGSGVTVVGLYGGSGSGGGSYLSFIKNSTAYGFIGNHTAIFGTGTSNDIDVYSTSNVNVYANGSSVGVFSSTGLAVTGKLSATDQVIAGSTGSSGNAWFRSGASLASYSGLDITDSSNTSNAGFAVWRNGSGTAIGTITRVGTTNAVAYNTTSDARLKTNFRDIVDSGAIIDALRPRLFDWKSGEKDTYGFIAQEVYQVFPQAVSKGDDDPEKISKQWAMDAGKLMPVAIAEIKNLRSQVQTLEKQNADLQARLAAIEAILKDQGTKGRKD